MNSYLLAQRLGRLSPPAFQRVQNDRHIRSLEPEPDVEFTVRTVVPPPELSLSPSNPGRNSSLVRPSPGTNFPSPHNLPAGQEQETQTYAHKAGVSVLAIDQHAGRYLFSGGADATIRLWDLETPTPTTNTLRSTTSATTYYPTAALLRSTPSSHTHTLTSLSIYPHDPTPSTILSTSHDKTLKLFSLTPSAILPIHTFPLPSTPHSHSLPTSPSTPHPSLVAIGTSHPLLPLLDLRSGSSTHSLPGHASAILSVAWSPSPTSPHTLAASSVSGAVLFFDIRRANSAFACLDADDAIGVLPLPQPSHTTSTTSYFSGRLALDWTANAKAHAGPVTGVRWTSSGRQIVTCGHDQRIRVWDAVTGRNELVHFGPRVRNARYGEFAPLLAPGGFDGVKAGGGGEGGETMLWANDDGKGEIFEFDLLEGTLRRVLHVPGVVRSDYPAGGRERGRGKGMGRRLATTLPTTTGKMTSSASTNAMVWRVNAGSGSGMEMYSGHGDGKIRAWTSRPFGTGNEDEDEDALEREEEEEQRRKRKRDVLGELVEGLTKKPVRFD